MLFYSIVDILLIKYFDMCQEIHTLRNVKLQYSAMETEMETIILFRLTTSFLVCVQCAM